MLTTSPLSLSWDNNKKVVAIRCTAQICLLPVCLPCWPVAHYSGLVICHEVHAAQLSLPAPSVLPGPTTMVAHSTTSHSL